MHIAVLPPKPHGDPSRTPLAVNSHDAQASCLIKEILFPGNSCEEIRQFCPFLSEVTANEANTAFICKYEPTGSSTDRHVEGTCLLSPAPCTAPLLFESIQLMRFMMNIDRFLFLQQCRTAIIRSTVIGRYYVPFMVDNIIQAFNATIDS